MLQIIDEETNYQYTDVIQKRIRKDQFNSLRIEKKYMEVTSEENDE